MSLKVTVDFKTYKDKFVVLPLEELSWQNKNKIFTIRVAFLKWSLSINFNF
jgi:hypothetical protein